MEARSYWSCGKAQAICVFCFRGVSNWDREYTQAVHWGVSPMQIVVTSKTHLFWTYSGCSLSFFITMPTAFWHLSHVVDQTLTVPDCRYINCNTCKSTTDNVDWIYARLWSHSDISRNICRQVSRIWNRWISKGFPKALTRQKLEERSKTCALNCIKNIALGDLTGPYFHNEHKQFSKTVCSKVICANMTSYDIMHDCEGSKRVQRTHSSLSTQPQVMQNDNSTLYITVWNMQASHGWNWRLWYVFDIFLTDLFRTSCFSVRLVPRSKRCPGAFQQRCMPNVLRKSLP